MLSYAWNVIELINVYPLNRSLLYTLLNAFIVFIYNTIYTINIYIHLYDILVLISK